MTETLFVPAAGDLTATLWPKLDSAIVSLIGSEMGSDGDYSTLVLTDVLLSDVWTPDNWNFPSVIVSSNQATQAPGGHGYGEVHVEVTYDYQVVGIVTAASYANARDGAQVMLSRLRDTIRGGYPTILGVAGDDGETVQDITWSESYIEIRGRNTSGGTVGRYFGVAVMLFNVEATTS